MVGSDDELIAGSLRDPGLFAGVFDRHYGAIAGYLRRRLEPTRADEAASETFLRAFDARARPGTGRRAGSVDAPARRAGATPGRTVLEGFISL